MPSATFFPSPWQETLTTGGELAADKLADRIRPEDPGRLLLVHVTPRETVSAPGAEGSAGLAAVALAQAQQRYPDAPVFHLREPAGDLISQAIAPIRREAAAAPLAQWYELAAVREGPGGTLIPTTQRLFPPGVSRGAPPRRFTFWVAPAEDPRTVFAVLARDDETEPPAYTVMSMESAPLAPGRHDVTATLLRPGKVRFAGESLPKPLEPEPRTWAEVRAAVPRQIPRSAPAHLTIALELCEPQVLFAQRVDCATRLIEDIGDGATAPVRYSLVGYGSHAPARMARETQIEEACWADDAPAALGALDRLRDRGALADGSAHGAKLECALHHIKRRLATDGTTWERQVLVTIGTRPPFPWAQDGSDALPCPWGLHWRSALKAMAERHDGMAFGAVYDGEPTTEAWEHLGSDARGLPSGFHARRFGMTLGLIGQGLPAFPLPLILDGGR
ncbi:MAG: hypothetical protein J2P25_19880 [Nocardiopsaceae bacterium]|nr:hypothetical protein [Nocardiopsaceae bacterium]